MRGKNSSRNQILTKRKAAGKHQNIYKLLQIRLKYFLLLQKLPFIYFLLSCSFFLLILTAMAYMLRIIHYLTLYIFFYSRRMMGIIISINIISVQSEFSSNLFTFEIVMIPTSTISFSLQPNNDGPNLSQQRIMAGINSWTYYVLCTMTADEQTHQSNTRFVG